LASGTAVAVLGHGLETLMAGRARRLRNRAAASMGTRVMREVVPSMRCDAAPPRHYRAPSPLRGRPPPRRGHPWHTDALATLLYICHRHRKRVRISPRASPHATPPPRPPAPTQPRPPSTPPPPSRHLLITRSARAHAATQPIPPPPSTPIPPSPHQSPLPLPLTLPSHIHIPHHTPFPPPPTLPPHHHHTRPRSRPLRIDQPLILPPSNEPPQPARRIQPRARAPRRGWTPVEVAHEQALRRRALLHRWLMSAPPVVVVLVLLVCPEPLYQHRPLTHRVCK